MTEFSRYIVLKEAVRVRLNRQSSPPDVEKIKKDLPTEMEEDFLVCFLVVFDILFAFCVFSRRVLDSAALFILYVHEHDRLGFGMLTVETAVFDCIC